MHCLYASYARPVPARIGGSKSREATCIARLSLLAPGGGRRSVGCVPTSPKRAATVRAYPVIN